MDRRLLFPAIAATAWAQQTSPAAVEAERALRARVEQFYQLEVDQKFRQAEALVAEDSKDYFYAANKPTFEGFSYTKTEFLDDNTRAKVTVKVKAKVMFPGVGVQIFDVPATSRWKLENGQWSWYFDPDDLLNTPFGRMTPGRGDSSQSNIDMTGKAPDLGTIESQVSVDRRSVVLTADQPQQIVTISNNLPGTITLELGKDRIDGLLAELSKTELKSGEKTTVQLRRTGERNSTGILKILALPLNLELAIQVKVE